MNHKFDDPIHAPIGVFDSGVGGISVLRALVEEMPNENFWYYGDSANAPYGVKSVEEVRELTISYAKMFIESGAKAFVVACNTATSAAVRKLREMYPDFPIVGIEPALKPAVNSKEHPNVLVMATPTTLREEKFHNLMDRYTDQAHIVPLPCGGLVEYIEQGDLESPELENYLRKLLEPFDLDKIDAIVLGCTHYPFVSKQLKKIVGEKVLLFEGGPGTARETKRRIAEKNLLTDSKEPGTIIYENSMVPNEDKIALCKRLIEIKA